MELLGRPFGPEETMNERPKKDKHLCLLTLRVKIHSRASDPVKRREHEHHSGATEDVYQSRHPPHPTPSVRLELRTRNTGIKL